MGHLAVRISFDPEADAAYIYLVNQVDAGESKRQVPVPRETSEDAMVVLDYDSEGRFWASKF